MRIRIARLALSTTLALACTVGFLTPLLSRPMQAQTNTTGLSGEVTDPTGALVPGVTVTILDPTTGFTKTVKSQGKGGYSFDQIKPGRYTVTITAPGYAEQVKEVELLVATPLKVNFKLTLGATEVVDVAAGLESINSTDATLGKAFDTAQVQNLPFLANNVNYLLSLQPGVLALDPGTAGSNTDPRTGIVNGARGDQTNLTLDGVDNNDPNNGIAFVGILRSTRDSVEEFRVTTTNANADAGRSSGGQVSVSTRSGTNKFHGSGYEYYRDPGVAANSWFNKQTQLTGHKPNIAAKVLQHTYGASLGAPIIKNKLFFFGAYEGFSQASDQVVSQTVPSILVPPTGETPVSVNGSLVGGLVTGNVAYALKSGAGTEVLSRAVIATMDQNCTQCPNGPGTDQDAINYFLQFPAANSLTGGDGFNTGTYTFTSPAPIKQVTNVSRIDYTINQRQSVFIRGTLQQDNSLSALQFPGQPANSKTFGNNKGLAVGHIWSITNNLTNNLRYGFTRQGSATRGAGAHPYVSFAGFTTLTGTSTDSIVLLVTNNFVDDMTYVKGRHTLQFGANDRLITNNRYANGTLYPTGAVSAGPLSTATVVGSKGDLDVSYYYPTLAPTSGDKSIYNNAILDNAGAITSTLAYTNFRVQNNALVPVASGVPNHIYKAFEQEYYFSDQWKATDRLTLTAGLRYTYLGIPYEIHGQQVAPNINLGTFLQNRIAAAAQGTAYTTRFSVSPAGSANGAPNLWTPQKFNFAPRLSFAYSTPGGHNSIRGGFALAFDHFGEAVIDAYDTGGALALSYKNTTSYPAVANAQRFTAYQSVPPANITATAQSFPVTNADYTLVNFTGSYSSGDINATQKTPYAETFNLSLQHEGFHGMTVTASYVGRLGRHLLSNLDVATPTNLYDPGSNQTYYQAVDAYDALVYQGVTPGNIPKSGYFQNVFPNASYGGYTGAQAYYDYLLSAGDSTSGNETDALYYFDVSCQCTGATPTLNNANPKGNYQFFNPQYTSLYVDSTIGTSNYNALQLSVRHAFKYGNEYDVNYTLSKSMDLGSSPERSGGGSIINAFSPRQNYAVSDFDVRHNVTANYNLSLPFGKGQPFFNGSGLLDRIIGGFKLNGTAHYSTGFPWSVTSSGAYGTDFANSSYATQIAPLATGGHRYVANGIASYETALKSATSAQGAAAFRASFAGQAGQRNNLRADGYLSVDDGLSKSFKTYRDQSFKISAEVFNVLNDVRFSAPSSAITSSSKFGNYTGSLLTSPRQMQFSGKYIF